MGERRWTLPCHRAKSAGWNEWFEESHGVKGCFETPRRPSRVIKSEHRMVVGLLATHKRAPRCCPRCCPRYGILLRQDPRASQQSHANDRAPAKTDAIIGIMFTDSGPKKMALIAKLYSVIAALLPEMLARLCWSVVYFLASLLPPPAHSGISASRTAEGLRRPRKLMMSSTQLAIARRSSPGWISLLGHGLYRGTCGRA